MKVDFPMKECLFISRSPINHTVGKGKAIIPSPRYYIEKLSEIVKKRHSVSLQISLSTQCDVTVQ